MCGSDREEGEGGFGEWVVGEHGYQALTVMGEDICRAVDLVGRRAVLCGGGEGRALGRGNGTQVTDHGHGGKQILGFGGVTLAPCRGCNRQGPGPPCYLSAPLECAGCETHFSPLPRCCRYQSGEGGGRVLGFSDAFSSSSITGDNMN